MNIKVVNSILASLVTFNAITVTSYSSNFNNSISYYKPPINNQTECINNFEEYSNDPVSRSIKNIFTSKTHNGLSTKEYNWYFKPNNQGNPPEGAKEANQFMSKYDCYYLGDTSKKVLYLTFDEGYENGYTAPILDVLKKHNVKAAFFVVKPYITSNKELVKRMVDEGHLVCNHSARHPSMASIFEEDKFNKELSDVEEAFEQATGKKMAKFFRPPMGKYSELSLNYTKAYGYKTIFWSFAYKDWEPKNQPSHEFGKNIIAKRTHNGAIVLLHAVSKTNAEILDDVISRWEKEGYEIKSLNELPK